MFKFIRFLIGYVKIYVDGINAEKVINIFLKRKISIWHVRRVSETRICFYMYADDYVKNIKTAVRKTGCTAKIIKKSGLYFFNQKYRERKVLLIASLIAILLIVLSSMSVWRIDIICDDSRVSYNASLILDSLGIKEGSLINKIDTKKVANMIMLSDNRLSWVSIKKKGTVLSCELILDETYKRQIATVDESVPCDIVALKDCVIYKIDLAAGNKMVETGQTVSAGEVIIRGIGYENELNNPDKGYEYESKDIHAKGKVLGLVSYVSEIEIKNTVQIMQRTGNKNIKKSFLLFGRKISIPSFKKKYEFYDSIYYENYVYLGDKITRLPIGLATDVEYETELVNVILDNNQAISFAKMHAQSQIDEQIPDDSRIINTNTKYIEREGTKYIRIEATCLENVGVDLN